MVSLRTGVFTSTVSVEGEGFVLFYLHLEMLDDGK